MGRKWTVAVTTVVAAMFAMVVVAQAQPIEDVRKERKELRKQERELKRQERELRREQMRDRVELMLMWKLTEALDLDDETATKLFPLLKESNKRQRELREKRRDMIKQIEDEVDKEAPDSTVLRSMIDEFKKNERAMVDARIQRLDSFSEILTDEQIAKMIALVPKFERRVKDMIHEGRRMRKERRMNRGNFDDKKGGRGWDLPSE